MKRNAIFDEYISKVPRETIEEVSLNIDIANRICDILKSRGMTQRDFAALMGKRESEISRWLSGSRGFTTATLAKMAVALGEPIIEIGRKRGSGCASMTFWPYPRPSDGGRVNYRLYKAA